MAFVARVAGFGSANNVSTVTGSVTTATSGTGSLLVSIGFGNQGGTVTSVTDTQGNAYVRDYAAPPGSTSGRGLEVWRCAFLRSLSTSDTITVVVSASQDHGIDVVVDQVDFVAAPDVTNYTYANSVTAIACAIDVTSTDTLAYSAIAINGPATGISVSGGSYATTGSVVSPGLTVEIVMQGAAWGSPTAGTQTATWSWTNSHSAVVVALGYPVGQTPPPRQHPGTAVWRRSPKQISGARVGPGVFASAGIFPGIEVAGHVFPSFVKALLTGQVDVTTDTLQVLLVASGTYSWNSTSLAAVSVADFLAGSGSGALTEVSASGYSRQTLATIGITSTISAPYGYVTVTCSTNPTWTGVDLTTVYACAFDNSIGGTDTTNQLICWYDLGGQAQGTSASPFGLDYLSANGVDHAFVQFISS